MIIPIQFVEIENIKTKPETVKDLVRLWKTVAKEPISKRVQHYKDVFIKGNDEAIFAELAFCVFTPQSKALSCWKAINIFLIAAMLVTMLMSFVDDATKNKAKNQNTHTD